MIPKGKALALLMIFTAVGGVAATGAFTTVQADRAASVSTAGDSDALLAIEESTSDFTTTTDDEIEINFQDPNDATGVNQDAETLEDSVINITNNGNDVVTFSATASTQNGAEIEFYVEDDQVSNADSVSTNTLENSSVIDNDVPTNLDGGNRFVINSESNGVVLNPGDTVSVGMYISTDNITSTSGGGTELFDQSGDPVTITANATDTGALTTDDAA